MMQILQPVIKDAIYQRFILDLCINLLEKIVSLASEEGSCYALTRSRFLANSETKIMSKLMIIHLKCE